MQHQLPPRALQRFRELGVARPRPWFGQSPGVDFIGANLGRQLGQKVQSRAAQHQKRHPKRLQVAR